MGGIVRRGLWKVGMVKRRERKGGACAFLSGGAGG